MNKESKLFKYIYCKNKNRRVAVMVYRDDDGELTFVIITKRLQGDWKDRNILSLNVVYGFDSMAAIMEILEMITDDVDFKKAANRFVGMMEKERYKVVATNTKGVKVKKHFT